MSAWVKKKLNVQITLLLLAGLGAIGAIMYYMVWRNASGRYESEKKIYSVYGATLIRNLASNGNLIIGIWSQNKDLIGQEVDKLFGDKITSYAVVYDSNMKVVYEKYGPGLEGIELKLSSAEREGKKEGLVVREISPARKFDFLEFQTTVVSEGIGEIGSVRTGISLAGLVKQRRNALVGGYSLIGVMLLFGLAIALIIQRTMIPPINRLVEGARKMRTGDYDIQVEVSSENELGMLTNTFNEMAIGIKEETERSSELIKSIAEAVIFLTETTSHLLSVTTEQASGATEQATVVEEVVSTTEEISATADRIATSAGAVNQAASQTSEAANKGSEYMSSSLQGMELIMKQVDVSDKQIDELARQAQMIGGILEIIADISEQTDLLALNAAIEAAGAGEAGKRFSVVAREVGRLANRTLEATESVRKMVEAIQKAAAAMVVSSENQHKAVMDGVQAVQSMGEYFGHIIDMVEATRRASSEIGLITRQQSTATQQMVSSIHEVEEVAKDVEKGVKEIEASMHELNALSEKLKSLIT